MTTYSATDADYVENMSMADIGTIMDGVRKMAVSKRLNKLLLNLRSLMET